MSLTDFVQEKGVREYFQATFRKPKNPNVSGLAVISSLTKNPTMVGTAFDYLARLMARTVNLQAIERDHWVADSAVVRLPPELQERAVEIVQTSRSAFKQFLKDDNLSDAVIAASVSLARLDTVFRTGGRYAESINDPVQPEEISDLRSLVSAMPLDQFKAKKKCFLNPTFGDASRAIGGADADLILDDLLLDIKVKKDAAIRVEDFHQLVGYYLLYEIGNRWSLVSAQDKQAWILFSALPPDHDMADFRTRRIYSNC